MSKKVCIVSTNRSDFSKLEPVIEQIKVDDSLQLMLILLGSHLVMECGNTHELVSARHPVHTKLHTLMAGNEHECMADSVAMVITKLSHVLRAERPHVVVVHGDRFDAFGAACAAVMLNICVVHLEGGELSGTIDGSLRHALTKLSHCHCVSNEEAMRRVLQLGEEPDRVHVTGCPSYDAHLRLLASLTDEMVGACLLRRKLERRSYLIVIHHPNVLYTEEELTKEYDAVLHAICEWGRPTLLFYPNADPGNKSMIRRLHAAQKERPDFFSTHVTAITSVPFTEFAILLAHCGAIVGNSSAGVREACLTGVGAVNVGNRQDGRKAAASSVVHVPPGCTAHDIVSAISTVFGKSFPPELLYGAGDAAEKIVSVIRGIPDSYTSKPFISVDFHPSAPDASS